MHKSWTATTTAREPVALVLCTYNGVKWVTTQVESLLGQTDCPAEVLLSDDASTDETWPALQVLGDRLRGRGSVVSLHRNAANMGYVSHFADALVRATGDVIFLCDQDDIWHPDKLAVMARYFERDPALVMVHSDARLVDATGADTGCTLFEALQLTPIELEGIHAGRAFEVLVRRSCVTGATMAIRRELLQWALPVGAGWIHDEWLAVIAAAVGKVDVIERPLIDYRQHGGNQIGMRRRTWRDKWEDLRRARGAQFRAEVARLHVLDERLQLLGARVAPSKRELLAERTAHLERRIALGSSPHLRRLPGIWREWRRGAYRRYGTGWRSALRDFLRRD